MPSICPRGLANGFTPSAREHRLSCNVVALACCRSAAHGAAAPWTLLGKVSLPCRCLTTPEFVRINLHVSSVFHLLFTYFSSAERPRVMEEIERVAFGTRAALKDPRDCLLLYVTT